MILLQSTGRQHLVRVSMLEIYNEDVVDLLTGADKLVVSNNARGEVQVSQLSEIVVRDTYSILELIERSEGTIKFLTAISLSLIHRCSTPSRGRDQYERTLLSFAYHLSLGECSCNYCNVRPSPSLQTLEGRDVDERGTAVGAVTVSQLVNRS